MGGKRDDRNDAFRWRQRPYPFSRFDAVEDRHLHVHQDNVVIAVQDRRDRLLSILGDIDIMAGLMKQHDREPLVDLVIFGQQDAQWLTRDLWDQDRFVFDEGRTLPGLAE